MMASSLAEYTPAMFQVSVSSSPHPATDRICRAMDLELTLMRLDLKTSGRKKGVD